jgi:hypothetical protein
MDVQTYPYNHNFKVQPTTVEAICSIARVLVIRKGRSNRVRGPDYRAALLRPYRLRTTLAVP